MSRRLPKAEGNRSSSPLCKNLHLDNRFSPRKNPPATFDRLQESDEAIVAND